MPSKPEPVPEKAMLRRGKEFIEANLGAKTPSGRVSVTVANWLTLTRLAIVPLFWFAFFSGELLLEFIGTLLFVLGALTDLWDGHLARSRGEVTSFGNFMDPLADKLLVLSAYWALLIREDFGVFHIAALLFVIVITIREVGLTLLRIWAIRGGSAVKTSIWGKLKTGVQLTTLIATLLAFNLREFLSSLGSGVSFLEGFTFNAAVSFLLLLCVLTTVVSGVLYLRSDSVEPGEAA